KLLDSVVETNEGLMERYLEGEELGADEVAHALKDAVTRGELFPVACGVATKNLATTALLDLLVEGIPSPAKRPPAIDVDGAGTAGAPRPAGGGRIHREVAVDRLMPRLGVEVDLHQPWARDLGTVGEEGRAGHRYKKRTGAGGQLAAYEIVVQTLHGRAGYVF